ncbi:MAG: LacI family DNA-binding transcriptional regulator [Opitutales bacterium]
MNGRRAPPSATPCPPTIIGTPPDSNEPLPEKGTRKAASVRRLAELAGVSRMTVSRVLRNDPRVAKATRKKVLAVVREANYRPNPMVTALMSQIQSGRESHHRATLAYLDLHRDSLDEVSQDHNRFYRGMEQRADELGFSIDYFGRAQVNEVTKLKRILEARSISGLILRWHQYQPPPNDLQAMLVGPYASALIGTSRPYLPTHSANNHTWENCRILMEVLWSRRYRRFGWAGEFTRFPNADPDYRMVYDFFLKSRPGAERVPSYGEKVWTQKSFATWLKKHRPEVVISKSLVVLDWIREAGFRVPEDVGFCDPDLVTLKSPVAGVFQDYEGIGAAAVDLVEAQLHRNETGVPFSQKTVLISGSWIEGLTVPEP